ncbi:DUF5339 domain-containing protein [Citrobacter rodentium]|uniref:Exported protein n=2 Tax=Citrobacter rodentium TaxID=67825 RepID=D2TKL2_CITRI|nr:DUF5339 domain-containing protein [Citrobacter rodentium]KIQ51402.1 hypothetical protein TA05_10385 [Citrobacter rodentium]QBY29485.1 hypothetical protein E2R62_11835 [Citrobacter rodentium]UHO33119.1 DUF5339 domain-containing protein [Citrobacter rodentium NBRC 105723 = DSM 16636]CBG89784.1 putative exported protein [Citrobacter rodentium ICC168]HAT8012525.1 hypothetical protein [Citrobacter rodentium NBRC 105723 = DSM 16636]
MKKLIFVAALTLASGSSFAAITETCQQYFNDVDALIVEASKTSEQAKQQMEAMKPQLEQAKEQLAALPAENQDAGCKQGAAALVQMKQSMGIK